MVRNLCVAGSLIGVVALVTFWRGADPDVASPAPTSNAASVAQTPTVSAPTPKAVPVANVHQFGIMNPGDRRTHSFTVRNDGDAPLTLKLGSTTCKCTLANLESAVVPPRGKTEIELDWHAEEAQFRFRQAAVVDTNDPKLPQFELAVEGSVRVKLGTIPERVVFSQIPRDEKRTVELAIFSQAYESVRIEKVEPTASWLQAEISESEENLDIEHATWARDAVVTKLPGDKSGAFEGKVLLSYVGRTPAGVEERGTHEVAVYGETVGDVTAHGRHVVGGTLMFGQLSRLQGKTSRAYVHFRSAPDDISVELIKSDPEFLQVTVGRPERLSPTITRVPLDVVVPPGAETVSYSNASPGHIGLKTNCAAFPKVWLPVTLVVEP